MHAVIADVEGLLERLIGSHIQIEMSLGADRSGVRTDAGQLEQVIVNLAVNARDAMSTGGRLDLRTRTTTVDERGGRELGITPGDYVELVVADTGTGMPPEVVANAFEPFFTTQAEGSGTGLGLAMVYGCVTASAGHVRVESVEGRGTAVSVLLPRCDAEPVSSAPAAPISPGSRTWQPGRGRDPPRRGPAHGAPAPHDEPRGPRLPGARRGGRHRRAVGGAGPAVRCRSPAHRRGDARDVAVPIGGPQGPGFLQKPFSLQELGSAVREVLARSDAVAS